MEGWNGCRRQSLAGVSGQKDTMSNVKVQLLISSSCKLTLTCSSEGRPGWSRSHAFPLVTVSAECCNPPTVPAVCLCQGLPAALALDSCVCVTVGDSLGCPTMLFDCILPEWACWSAPKPLGPLTLQDFENCSQLSLNLLQNADLQPWICMVRVL